MLGDGLGMIKDQMVRIFRIMFKLSLGQQFIVMLLLVLAFHGVLFLGLLFLVVGLLVLAFLVALLLVLLFLVLLLLVVASPVMMLLVLMFFVVQFIAVLFRVVLFLVVMFQYQMTNHSPLKPGKKNKAKPHVQVKTANRSPLKTGKKIKAKPRMQGKTANCLLLKLGKRTLKQTQKIIIQNDKCEILGYLPENKAEINNQIQNINVSGILIDILHFLNIFNMIPKNNKRLLGIFNEEDSTN
uniref:Uncharacterized protein n=1 Tax=viral metagenome TaxID=1070528 RepID=A0A6C0H8L8_9ZZZZ